MEDGEPKEQRQRNFITYLVFIWLILLMATIVQRTTTNYGSTFIVGNVINVTSGSTRINFTVTSNLDNDNITDGDDTFIGNVSSLSTTGIATPNITIDGSTAINATYGKEHATTIYNAGTPIINFTHNFSGDFPIYLKKIIINQTSNYTIVDMGGQLLPAERKTIWITDSDFTSLCVKDATVVNINLVSDACTGENETSLTSCLADGVENVTVNNITCAPQGNRFKISNLKHSAIRGIPSVAGNSPSTTSSTGSGHLPKNTSEEKTISTDKKSLGIKLVKNDADVERITIKNNDEEKIMVVISIQGSIRSHMSMLLPNGEEEQEREIVLEPSETKTISFVIRGNKEGIYRGIINLGFNGQSSIVPVIITIQENKPGPPSVSLKAKEETIQSGGILDFDINIEKIGKKVQSTVQLGYTITEKRKDTLIVEYAETIAFSEKILISRSIVLPPETLAGSYVLHVTVSDSDGATTLAVPFEVEKSELRNPSPESVSTVSLKQSGNVTYPMILYNLSILAVVGICFFLFTKTTFIKNFFQRTSKSIRKRKTPLRRK